MLYFEEEETKYEQKINMNSLVQCSSTSVHGEPWGA